MEFEILHRWYPSAQNHRWLRDFILSVAPLGRATGVRDVVQIVWLPVARSQKAFASRKRIKAFHRAAVCRIQSSGKSFVTAFDLHSGRPSCTTCGIDARSLAVTSINNELQFWILVNWIKYTLFISRKFSNSVRKQFDSRVIILFIGNRGEQSIFIKIATAKTFKSEDVQK